ncbi:MAG: Lipoprotein-releasing system ATP-binding protein LolD [Geminicoccaceae bacterium]|nr:Lipoprotein-releasing system ATP-binding protein LolD [Geminicoccaceae bacterium]
MNDAAGRAAATCGAATSGVALRLAAISRKFRQGEAWLEVLRGVDLELAPGAVIALMGPSGSGKSTLLQIAGLLEHPDGGEVYLGGRACGRLSDAERTRIRRDTLGFVYQFHHLLPEFSALENVMLPRMLAGHSRATARARARELLAALGVDHRESHRPARLSGGEQQRVAIARAMANRPAVLLADEPTGNLDEETASGVFGTLVRTARETAAALLVATHNADLAGRADYTLRLHNGVVEPV